MNEIGALLVWCAIQVSMVALFAAGLFWTFRCAGWRVGPLAPLVSLLMIGVLPVIVFFPAPSWFHLAAGTSVETSIDENVSELPLPNEETTAPNIESKSASISKATSELPTQAELPVLAQVFMEELLATNVDSARQSNNLKWTGILAWIFIGGTVVGVLHLAVGLLWMRAYRRCCRTIDEPEMLQLLDTLRGEMNCHRTVAFRESTRLSTPATVGWLRPMILLPPEWKQWSQHERRTVLAHELAHICGYDYLACVCAQISLAIHFYHPIVHWLVAQLRLEQELAADELAAASSGGRKTYLTTLTEMALRQSDRRMSWAASAFVQTRSAFLRRIAMLRQDKTSNRSKRVGLLRVAMIGTMVVMALAMVGLRSPNPLFGQQSDEPNLRQQDAKERDSAKKKAAKQRTNDERNTSKIAEFSLAYVPRDAAMVAAVRPAALLQRPSMKKMADAIEKADELKGQTGISIDRVEQFTTFFLARGNDDEPDFGGFILRAADTEDAKAFVKNFASAPTKHNYNGQEYFKGGPRKYYFLGDDQTVVASEQEEYLRRIIIAGKVGSSKAGWAEAWKKVAQHDAAIQYNFVHIREMLNEEVKRATLGASMRSQAFYSQLAVLSPVWNNTDQVVVGIRLREKLSLSAIADCKDAEDAKKVKDTVAAVATLGRNTLSVMRSAASKDGRPDGAMILKSADIADGLLDKLNVTIDGDDVLVNSSVDSADSVEFVAMMVPAVQAARIAARRAVSMNNIKQIGLAFHNYYDVHKTFPKSKNGDGKHPHSWRVAILPYVEQKDLYEQYNFDEPWDSQHNKELLTKIPEIFRHPNAADGTTNTAYFVLVGEKTIFDNNTKFAKITDGMSNTILTVESTQEVPWTKPEDLSYDDEKPLPKLGGYFEQGFGAGFADGSVRFIIETIDEKMLRALMTATGGEAAGRFE